MVKGVGGLDHAAWRAFDNDRGTAPARGFVDGDLVEQCAPGAPPLAPPEWWTC